MSEPHYPEADHDIASDGDDGVHVGAVTIAIGILGYCWFARALANLLFPIVGAQ